MIDQRIAVVWLTLLKGNCNALTPVVRILQRANGPIPPHGKLELELFV